MVKQLFSEAMFSPYAVNYMIDRPKFNINDLSKPDCITVVSSNVRCYTNSDKGKRHWFKRAPLLVRTLRSAAPDIIGFQEVSKVHYDYLSKALFGYENVIKYRDNSRNPESCPIFFSTAKFEMIDKGAFWLSETPETPSKDWGAACYRICSYAILRQKSDGKLLVVFNTHLDHVSEEARIKGIRLVLDKIQKFGGMPAILMGDFNTFEDSETYRAATAVFDDAKYRTDDTDSGATYHAYGEEADSGNIDYFMISKEGINVKKYRVLRNTYNGVYPSDHYPIMIKMTLD